jgi:hypothetical protein
VTRRARSSPRGLALVTLLVFLAVASGCGPRRDPGAKDAAPPSDAASAAHARLLLFGVDGADWDRAVPLLREGKLPALERVMRTGARRTLRSLEPERLSPTIWTTVVTGVLPEKHGIHNFVAPSPDGSLQPVTSNQRKRAALWNIFTARGISVGVLGWLATWPAEPVKGYLVSSYTPFIFDWGAGKPMKGTIVDGIPDQVWPRELQKELEALKVSPASLPADALEARYRIAGAGAPPSDDARESLEGMRWSWAADETYLRIWRRLVAEPPGGERPRVELVYFGSVDVVSHRFWKYMEPSTYALGSVDPRETRFYGHAIEGAYRSLDETLAEVLGAEREEARVIVLSDHGFRENRDPKRASSSGWHRTQGLFVAAGPGFLENARLEPGSVVDVAPTVLYAAGLPAAEDMDGRPALELFTDEFRRAVPPASVASYEPETSRARWDAPVTSPVDDQILERLRALGYIQ